MRSRTGTTTAGRLGSLDALRGVAALIVVVHHVSMTIPAVSSAYASSKGVAVWSIGWWATESPLKILFAGPEFVLVFFVLSGFVLTRAVLRKPRYDWVAYYPRRVVRLIGPALVSVLFAAGLAFVLPRDASRATGWLANQGDPDLSLGALGSAVALLVGKKYPDVNPPLWSLSMEMWFSLLLPLGVVIALLSRRVTSGWLLGLLAVSALGYVAGVDAVSYLPAFAIGGLVAADEDGFKRLGSRLDGHRWSGAAWTALTLAAIAVLTLHWYLRPVVHGAVADELTLALRVPGALLLVLCAWLSPGLSRGLSARTLVWLGRVSFSLYLVHFPIVIGVAYAFGADDRWIAGLIAIPAALLVAQGMYTCVERPSQHVARAVGVWASRSVAASHLQLARLHAGPVPSEPAMREREPARRS
jgi:peptidoglycan/LPS O-acetylase OafA/YrhL